MYYVTDTHSLIWYLTEDKKLGKKAFSIFAKADRGEAIIIVPTIVLSEMIYICEKKGAELKIKDVIHKIKNSLNYVPYNLDIETLEKLMNIKNISEMHDRIITAIALLTGSILITKDKEITKSKTVETIW